MIYQIKGADRLVRVAAHEARSPSLETVKNCIAPTNVLTLPHKSRISEGMDADFVVFDEQIRAKKVFVRQGMTTP